MTNDGPGTGPGIPDDPRLRRPASPNPPAGGAAEAFGQGGPNRGVDSTQVLPIVPPTDGFGAPAGPPPMHPSDRRQRNIVIGLSIASALVLIVGVLVFFLTRNDSDDGVTIGAPTTAVAPSSTVPESTAPTTTTPTDTGPTTLVPVNAVANAGDDQFVGLSASVVVTATDLPDELDPESVVWRQTGGPAVIDLENGVIGEQLLFTAPDTVTTLTFELAVTGSEEQAFDDVVVRVLEDPTAAVFVDGERGRVGGSGTIDDPVRSISEATALRGRDIYVRSVGRYDERGGTIALDGVSLYGGFDDQWLRDPTQRAVIAGAPIAFQVSGDVVLSSVDVTGGDAAAQVTTIGVLADRAGNFILEDSRVLAGAAGATSDAGAAVSTGLRIRNSGFVAVRRSTVSGGRGGAAPTPASPAGDTAPAAAGGNGFGPDGGDRGGTGSVAGGDGGDGGDDANGSDGATSSAGNPGGGGGTNASRNGQPGGAGAGGGGGAGGAGATGVERVDGNVIPRGDGGQDGQAGSPGEGAGGGGGGVGELAAVGGGGGGGGAGGVGGAAGPGGPGGGGSAGIWATQLDSLVIEESVIIGGLGGNGARGATGAPGQRGGAGGVGAAGTNDDVSSGGAGGGGGGGGAGGSGGAGGAGAGGPSFGLLTTNVSRIRIELSAVRGGGGGLGGEGSAAGQDGSSGQPGNGANAGAGGAGPSSSTSAGGGAGGAGGASFGWFDNGGANETIIDSTFEAGVAGPGGRGVTNGPAGERADRR